MGEKTKGLPRLVFWIAGAGLVVALLFYAWVGVHANGERVAWWGQLGDSIALFSAVFNAGAMFAALSAVHLQRKESHDAAENTDRQLAAMQAQLAEFAKSSKAQEDLAAAMAELAKEQREANRLAWFAELAQRRSSLAALYDAKTSIDIARGRNPAHTSPWGDSVHMSTGESLDRVSAAIAEEQHRIEFLEKRAGVHRTSPGGLDDKSKEQG